MYKFFLGLRAFLFYAVTAFWVVLFTTLLYLALPCPFKIRLHISRLWSRLILYSARWICGLRYKISGFENIPPHPVVFLSKHQSAWETMVFPGLLPPNCFVCKDSLLKIPFFGWSLALCKPIPIDRKASVQAFKKIIKLGQKRLREGLSIVIFPEGTRVAPSNDPPFFKTAASLAKANHAQIIPIAHNSGSCWRRNGFLKYPGLIHVVIGSPIHTQNLSTEEINQQAYDWIKTTMKNLEEA